MERIHEMEKCVHSIGDEEALEAWARLQASHHFHALAATAVQNPYAGPADGHARLMAALDRLESALPGDSG